MPVPLALAGPAAIAGLAYLNARTSFGTDVRLIRAAARAASRTRRKEQNDKLSQFYLLEEAARGKHANSTFIIFEGRQWTYKETYDIVLKYGTWLKEVHNVQSKDIVAMDFMNSEKFIFLWFGLWSIGAKPAFLNYNLSGNALAHCIRVAGTKLVLIDPEVQDNVTQEVRDGFPNITFQVFTPDIEGEVMSTNGIRPPDSARSESKSPNIASLVYTSGTTGLPKPGILSWLKINIGADHFSNWLGCGRKDIFYTCMPLYHTSANLLGFSAMLSCGATIAIGKKFSNKTFWKEVRESNATIIQYVGETCRYLLAAPPQFDPVTGESLDKKNNVLMACGNGLRGDIWNQFKERFGIQTIAEFYAATEASSGSWNFSSNDFSKGAIGRNGTLVGWLLNRGSWVVVQLDWENEKPYRDPSTGLCKEAPSGKPGEMLYRLDPDDIYKVYQGYFNNASSSEGKVIRNVLKKGDAYFRTGDVISWDSEGRNYFHDRLGDTFRWKSENVSTNEVSQALGSHPVVQEANVYGVELPHHDGRAGCAAVVLREKPNDAVLRSLAEHVQKELPHFAIPLFLRVMKEMQMTGTYKQQKHVVRAQGVDPESMGGDEMFWLNGGTYRRFRENDWVELRGGRVKL